MDTLQHNGLDYSFTPSSLSKFTWAHSFPSGFQATTFGLNPVFAAHIDYNVDSNILLDMPSIEEPNYLPLSTSDAPVFSWDADELVRDNQNLYLQTKSSIGASNKHSSSNLSDKTSISVAPDRTGRCQRKFTFREQSCPRGRKTRGMRAREKSSKEDLEMKRMSTLERNRLSARTYRTKTKNLISDLEQAEHELMADNHKMRAEYEYLSNEIFVLRNQLMMHRFCNDAVIQRWLRIEGKD